MADVTTLLRKFESAARINRLELYRPYPWQEKFHNAGAENSERAGLCANGVGKTFMGAIETAIHLTGLYPEWWKGKRFADPPLVWIGTLDSGFQKDNNQRSLLGTDLGENYGTGWIPRHLLYGKPKTRTGSPDVVETVAVRHKSGGLSYATFKNYEQGWRKWQGSAPNIVWLDEQPDDRYENERRIFTEVQTRIFRSRGIMYLTATPMLGETDTIRHFTQPRADKIACFYASWDDAPHLVEEEKERLRKTYPDHELQARTMGVPMMGEGRVLDFNIEDILVDPFELPDHFAFICGIDFGLDHPGAGAWIAWDRDRDIVYIYDCYKMKGQTTIYHAEAIKSRGDWIPVSWPHDGLNRKDDGSDKATPLWRMFVKNKVNMLPMSARFDDEKGGPQPVEAVVTEVIERARTGRLKVFRSCQDWVDEAHRLHRRDGRIVALHDDVMKASFYAIMMLRYAVPRARERMVRRHSEPIVRMW